MLGICGAIISGLQIFVCDFEAMQRAAWSLEIWLYIFGFVSCLFCMYVNTSVFLESGDSTFFNLSLLTSDVYAVIFSYFFTGDLVHWLYFVGFGLVLLGLFLYHSSKQPVSSIVCADNISSVIRIEGMEGSCATNDTIDYNPLTYSLTTKNVDINGGFVVGREYEGSYFGADEVDQNNRADTICV